MQHEEDRDQNPDTLLDFSSDHKTRQRRIGQKKEFIVQLQWYHSQRRVHDDGYTPTTVVHCLIP